MIWVSTGKASNFPKANRRTQSATFFPNAAKPHETFSCIFIFQAEKNIEVQFSGSHFFGCGFYARGSEAKFTSFKRGWIGVCEGFRVWEGEIAGFDFLPESSAEKVDPSLDCGDA